MSTEESPLEQRLGAWLRHLEAVPADVTEVSRSIVADELRQMMTEARAETPDEEPRYTLAEARMVMIRQECARRGHDWNILSTLGKGPVALHCDRGCGARRAVSDDG